MRLKINGEDMDIPGAVTISRLLEDLKITPGRVAVEVNMSIIKKAEYETFILKDSDAIEVVNFVGGGAG